MIECIERFEVFTASAIKAYKYILKIKLAKVECMYGKVDFGRKYHTKLCLYRKG